MAEQPSVEMSGERGALVPYKTEPTAIQTLMAIPVSEPTKAPLKINITQMFRTQHTENGRYITFERISFTLG